MLHICHIFVVKVQTDITCVSCDYSKGEDALKFSDMSSNAENNMNILATNNTTNKTLKLTERKF